MRFVGDVPDCDLFLLKCCWFCKYKSERYKREIWGQKQRVRGLVATFVHSENMQIEVFRVFVNRKGVLLLAKPIRDIIPMLAAV